MTNPETEAERIARLDREDREAARGQRLRRRSRAAATRYQQDLADIDTAPAAPKIKSIDQEEK